MWYTIQPTFITLTVCFQSADLEMHKTQPCYGSILVCMGPLSSFGTRMSISAWRRVILSTVGLRDSTACSISLIKLILHFMLTIHGLFIDADRTVEICGVVCEHEDVGVKRKCLQVKVYSTLQRVWEYMCLGGWWITICSPPSAKCNVQVPSSKVAL